MVGIFQTTQVGAFSLPESSTFHLFLGIQLAHVLMVLVMVRCQTGDKQLPVPTMTRMPDNKWRLYVNEQRYYFMIALREQYKLISRVTFARELLRGHVSQKAASGQRINLKLVDMSIKMAKLSIYTLN